jgi:hypothetical protein
MASLQKQPISALGEIIAVSCENDMKHTDALCGDNLCHKKTKFLSSFLYNIDIIGIRLRSWVVGFYRNDYTYLCTPPNLIEKVQDGTEYFRNITFALVSSFSNFEVQITDTEHTVVLSSF